MKRAVAQDPSPTPESEGEKNLDVIRIVSTPGTCGGKPRIAGHRIKVEHVAIWYERMGMSPDEIVSGWPSLSLAKVHAALSYYYDHREQIDADIREGDEFVEELRAGQPSLIDKIRPRSVDAPVDPIPPG